MHARKVQAWVERHAHDVKLFYLPAYAPDHNPDEDLNNELEQRLRQQPDDRNELVRLAPCSAHLAVARAHPLLFHAQTCPLYRLMCQV
jgi:hypothetical protein